MLHNLTEAEWREGPKNQVFLGGKDQNRACRWISHQEPNWPWRELCQQVVMVEGRWWGVEECVGGIKYRKSSVAGHWRGGTTGQRHFTGLLKEEHDLNTDISGWNGEGCGGKATGDWEQSETRTWRSVVGLWGISVSIRHSQIVCGFSTHCIICLQVANYQDKWWKEDLWCGGDSGFGFVITGIWMKDAACAKQVIYCWAVWS